MLVTIFLLILTAALAVYAWALRVEPRDFRREHHIRSFVFPATMLQSLVETYPNLQEKDTQLVARALRQFFIVHARSPKSVIGMPTRAVDELWHRFILDTHAYDAFCRAAFGKFFHHIPSGEMSNGSPSALRRTWRLACLEENINPERPTRLPLLFAIDAKLAIPGATVYTLDAFTRKSGDDGGGGGCGGGTGGGSGGDCGCGGGSCGGGGCGGGCGGE